MACEQFTEFVDAIFDSFGQPLPVNTGFSIFSFSRWRKLNLVPSSCAQMKNAINNTLNNFFPYEPDAPLFIAPDGSFLDFRYGPGFVSVENFTPPGTSIIFTVLISLLYEGAPVGSITHTLISDAAGNITDVFTSPSDPPPLVELIDPFVDQVNISINNDGQLFRLRVAQFSNILTVKEVDAENYINCLYPFCAPAVASFAFRDPRIRLLNFSMPLPFQLIDRKK